MPKSPMAIDIETVGQDWCTLAPEVQAYLLDTAKGETQREEVPEKLGLHPGTGHIVAIGLWHPDEDRGAILLEGGAQDWDDFPPQAKIFRDREDALLREFWRIVGDAATTIVTFYGRSFDAPYLMLRSAILGVVPSRNLLPYRYSFQEHCDLAEVLSFRNSRRPAGNLDFWCRQFGIESPKAEMRGRNVATLYGEGKLEEIARYCLGDARATARLYLRLRPIIRLVDQERA
ncbi:MAG TPA: ribonuclease H-like domain-containing protein [bacterium]|nr:ribonuclease H-like domain-containing protein [bacterium]